MGLSSGQIFCVWLILIGTVLLLLGSAAPYWFTNEGILTKGFDGLWIECVDHSLTGTDCSWYNWGDADIGDFSAWFFACHLAAGIATLMGLALVCSSCGKICGSSDSATGLGVLALICGILGVGAAAVFYDKEGEALYVETLVATALERDWAFYVFIVGSCIMAVFSIILLVLPKKSSVGPH